MAHLLPGKWMCLMSSVALQKPQLKAILIEDMLSVRMLLRAVLTHLEIEVVGEAKTAAQGMEQFRELEPDIVFLDLGLPDTDGLDLLPTFKRERPFTCVVVLTAKNDQDTVNTASDLGADHFIAKPFTVKRIGLVVEQVMRSREASLSY